MIMMNFGGLKMKDGSLFGKDINLELNFSSFIGIILENLIRLKRCLIDEYLVNECYPGKTKLYRMDNDDFEIISMQTLSDIINPNTFTVLYFGSCS